MFGTLVLAYGSLATSVLVALFVVFKSDKFFDNGSIYFKYYFLIAGIVDISLLVLQRLAINNIPVINLFCVVQFFLLASGLRFWVNMSENKVRLFNIVFYTATIAILSHVIITIRSLQLNVVSLGVENIILVLLSSVVLLKLTTDSQILLLKNYKFWLTVAVFLYFSVSTIVFATGNMLLENHIYLRRYTWIINSILSITANIFYIKGILCLPQKKK